MKEGAFEYLDVAYNDLVWCVGIRSSLGEGGGGATEKGPGMHVVLLPS